MYIFILGQTNLIPSSTDPTNCFDGKQKRNLKKRSRIFIFKNIRNCLIDAVKRLVKTAVGKVLTISLLYVCNYKIKRLFC